MTSPGGSPAPGFITIRFPRRSAASGNPKNPAPSEEVAQRRFELAVARELIGDCC